MFFSLAMDNSSHEYMEAQSGHGPCLKIGSTLSSLYTQNQIHQNSKHSKFQVPRFRVLIFQDNNSLYRFPKKWISHEENQKSSSANPESEVVYLPQTRQ